MSNNTETTETANPAFEAVDVKLEYTASEFSEFYLTRVRMATLILGKSQEELTAMFENAEEPEVLADMAVTISETSEFLQSLAEMTSAAFARCCIVAVPDPTSGGEEQQECLPEAA